MIGRLRVAAMEGRGDRDDWLEAALRAATASGALGRALRQLQRMALELSWGFQFCGGSLINERVSGLPTWYVGLSLTMMQYL